MWGCLCPAGCGTRGQVWCGFPVCKRLLRPPSQSWCKDEKENARELSPESRLTNPVASACDSKGENERCQALPRTSSASLCCSCLASEGISCLESLPLLSPSPVRVLSPQSISSRQLYPLTKAIRSKPGGPSPLGVTPEPHPIQLRAVLDTSLGG